MLVIWTDSRPRGLRADREVAGVGVRARLAARVDLRRAQVALRVEQVGAVAHRGLVARDVLERRAAQAPVELALVVVADAGVDRDVARRRHLAPSSGSTSRRSAESRSHQPPSGSGLTGSRLVIRTHSPLGSRLSSPSASQLTSSRIALALVGPEAAVVGVPEVELGALRAALQDRVVAVPGVLAVVGQPDRVALGDQRPRDVDPAAVHAHRDGAPQPPLGAARGVLRQQPHLVLARLQQLVQARGRLDGVALAAARGGAARVGRLLHRVHARDAHGEAGAGAVAVDVDVDRVAVGDERDLAGPEVALGPALAEQALAAAGGLGRGGSGGGGEQEGEEEQDQTAHRGVGTRPSGDGCAIARARARSRRSACIISSHFGPIAAIV